MNEGLIGIGLYTPSEAGRLIEVSPTKISRWLRGHNANGKHYEPLWQPQIEIDGNNVTLGFHDLMEVRVAASFIAQGLAPVRARQAIDLAREILGRDHPLSTQAFRTDGRSIFLQVIKEDGQLRLLDIFNHQYAFRDIVEQSLKHIDYDSTGVPALWWPLGRSKSVLIDPHRSFGQPIEAETSVPVQALVGAVRSEGSEEAAARIWDVPLRAVRRAMAFNDTMEKRKAA